MKKILAIALAILMIVSVMPFAVLASEFDTSVSNDYFKVISEDKYALAPGATETEMILNNADGNDRKVVHYFEVDTKNENIEVLPGYYGIDKLDPDNLALDGIDDKSQYWKAEQLTKTVAYYENMGYNVVGAMNTALAYDSDAPYGYMVWNGVVLGTPEVHKGAQTYLAIDAEGNCELRSMSTPLNGTEVTAVSANFNWIVKNGELVTKTVERTTSDASRSMIGIKADGTLVFCLVDGRNAPVSTGLSNYELGEMMLSLGCVNAVNCDGGGSSTFVSKREGESETTMRSVPSDGSERATINSVIIVSKAKATGEFDHAVLDSEYDYYAPTTSATITAKGVDAAGSPAELPEEGISWALSDDSFGTVADGVFTSNGKKGDVTVKMLYNGEVVGQKLIHVVDPDVFALALDETVLPYGKTMTIDFACTYGEDDWAVCVDGAYALTLSDVNAATINGNVLVAPTNESITGVNVTATYIPNPAVTDMLKVTYGKGSEIIWNFENNDTNGFMGFVDAKQWSIDNGINNSLVGSAPLAGQFNEQLSSKTFVSTEVVKNGNYALAWSVDNTDADFAGWSYNVLFNVGETIVLRDVANGKNATTLGMWLYIPEGAAGLAFQSQLYTYKKKIGVGADGKDVTDYCNPDDEGAFVSCVQDHFMFTTKSGVRKNLNSCTEAEIPESRWVYASIDISKYDYLCTPIATDETNSRSPSFIRTYVKPTAPAVHTFYIDDITLDYSSAVDDRVLPTISDVSYTTQDESKALDNGVVINGNSMAFSAVVADNIKLDNATGKIYVDGNALSNVTVSGKYLATTENVVLTSGVHTVKFEIKDTLGNTAVVIRTFTVAGDAAITLGGHNDSGNMPEYDSIYYVDINVADMANINKLTTELKLQTANTWEPQGIVVANGFKATYSLNATNDILTLVVERISNTLTASADETLVSIPVRLWSWNGVNNVTGEAIAPATQFATGYCPVVTVDCKVLTGTVEFVNSEYLGSFGGSISVATKINDDVYEWHVHDAELVALPDVEATCTTNGYYGRTYCEGCASVIDWGTIVEATGHDYNVVNGSIVCGNCGDTQITTGLVEIDGNTYYFINGKAATGWQMIGTDWYYFDPVTTAGVDGDVYIDPVTYNFVDGKLTSGVWAKTLYGNRYYYGPSYYNDRGSWRIIDGVEYYFEYGYTIKAGYQLICENQVNFTWYYFNEDGTCDRNAVIPDGFYTDRNGYAYSKDGKALLGIQEIDGKYYYFDYSGYARKNTTFAGRLFLDDYAAYTGLLEKDSVLYYYENGRGKMAGLVEIDGAYYFAKDGNGLCATGKQYVWAGNGILPEDNYEFGADGKMLNGIVERDGNYYYYNNGKAEMAGLIEIDGAYYFVLDGNGLCATGKKYVWKSNGLLPEAEYEFGVDGKMLNGIVERNGNYYYYENGRAKMAGLIEIDGAYYFAKDGEGLCVTGKYYVWQGNGILPEGNYEFGADGKMLDGIVERNGNYYFYENGKTWMAGLVEVDGVYYFVKDAEGLCVTGKYYVWQGNGILSESEYLFGADGKMLDGFVTKDDGIYYYENGKIGMVGLNYIDGYYYFVDYDGKLTTNGYYYVWAPNGYTIPMSYTFDAIGRIVL